MINLPETVTLPLKMDEHGDIRVSGTRVTLHTIITAYRHGERPEDIHRAFSTVPLADIYAVIGFYLDHRETVDAYIHWVDEESDRIQREWEARYTPEQKARAEHFRKLAAEKRKAQNT